jgi:hypothetical protein
MRSNLSRRFPRSIGYSPANWRRITPRSRKSLSYLSNSGIPGPYHKLLLRRDHIKNKRLDAELFKRVRAAAQKNRQSLSYTIYEAVRDKHQSKLAQ